MVPNKEALQSNDTKSSHVSHDLTRDTSSTPPASSGGSSAFDEFTKTLKEVIVPVYKGQVFICLPTTALTEMFGRSSLTVHMVLALTA